jgi:carbohydrate-selective porin OprB
MGSYAEAIEAYRAGRDSTPDITAHRATGRTKGGIGLNLEQEVAHQTTVFGRWGWNDGRNESFAYTEVDDTFEAGVDVRGDRWHRRADKFGIAWVSNGLSSGHRTYLELGGQGFLLGDGALRYGRETILESYYTAYLGAGVSPAVDLQWVGNPGYNRDRGPVLVASARLHFEL